MMIFFQPSITYKKPILVRSVFYFLLFYTTFTEASLDFNDLDHFKKIHLAYHYDINLSPDIHTLDQAMQSDSFEPITNGISLSTFNGPIWLKLKLENNTHTKKSLVWVNKYPRVQDIEVFIIAKKKIIGQYRVGEQYPFSTRPLPYRHIAIPIIIEPNQHLTLFIKPYTLGLKVTHHSEIQTEHSFFYDNKLVEFLHFFYFGILFIISLYSFLIHFILKDRSYLYYSGFVASSLLFFLCNSGYAFQYLWPNVPHLNQRIIYISMASFFCFAGWFSISFLSLKLRLPQISKAINLLCIGCILCLLYVIPQPFDPSDIATQLISLFSLPIYTLCFIGGILSWRIYQNRHAKVYTLACSLLIFVSLLALVNESIYKFSVFDVLTFLQIIHATEVFIFSMVLGMGISELKIKENLAQAKTETQSRFLAKMSHEIRTPMNAILGIADVLKARLTDNKDKHYAKVIYTNASSLSKIINDILDFSSIEAGKIKIIEKPFSLKVMTDNLRALFELEIKNKPLCFELSIDDKAPSYFIGDRDRIHQIMVNLISNAIKYTPSGLVSVEITASHEHLNFHVKDTGLGIAKKDHARLFRPFEQMQNNHLSSEYSTGLGLAICLDLAKAMNGSLDVVSAPSKGSVFTLSLPFKPCTQATIPVAPPVDNHRQLLYQSILIIEDNATNSLVIGAMLEKFGLPFHIASNGINGFTYFKEHAKSIDLIFMDCEMPLMDGYESTKSIRKFEDKQQLTKTPIIALTANTWPKQLEKCYHVGMDDLLLKPITIERVRHILAAFEPHSSADKEKLLPIHDTD